MPDDIRSADGTADSRFDLILLDPSRVRLFRTGGSAVRLTLDDPQIGPERSYPWVAIARAFPLSGPDRYIGLRDGQDKDIGMLATLDHLDAESSAIVDEELRRRYFLPRVLSVLQVKEEFGTTTWEVETDKGTQTFVIQNLRDAVQTLSPNRVLITDMDGNRWEIPDVSTLDDKSYDIIHRVM